MEANAIPGAAVLVRSPEGDWSDTFGTSAIGADDPVGIDDYFRVGSNTKTMTSTVILQLVEEGELSLDDPVSKYVDGVPNGDRITIANLSEMRSGLYSYTTDPAFNETLDDEPDKAWTPEELLEIAFSSPVNADPGTEFEYSNTNTVLLGVIIEQLTGQSVSDAFQERIFEPLGLEHTSLPAADDASIPDPHPTGYQFGTNADTVDDYAVPQDRLADALDGTLEPIDFTDANPSWAWAAGGAISTVDDLATYVEALVDGDLLDDATHATRMDSIVVSPSGAGYGLGIARFGPMFGHDGQLPGFSTFMGRDPQTKTTLVIALNLSAVPSDGQNAALVMAKGLLPIIEGGDAVADGAVGSPPADDGRPSATPEQAYALSLPVLEHFLMNDFDNSWIVTANTIEAAAATLDYAALDDDDYARWVATFEQVVEVAAAVADANQEAALTAFEPLIAAYPGPYVDAVADTSLSMTPYADVADRLGELDEAILAEDRDSARVAAGDVAEALAELVLSAQLTDPDDPIAVLAALIPAFRAIDEVHDDVLDGTAKDGAQDAAVLRTVIDGFVADFPDPS